MSLDASSLRYCVLKFGAIPDTISMQNQSKSWKLSDENSQLHVELCEGGGSNPYAR